MSTARARLMRRARRYLAIWKENIGLDNELGLTDINKDAEDFCCGLLNIILESELQNLNLLQMNFPAVDLADGKRRICVQVTSTAGAEKIHHTLERFHAHGLKKDYDRVIVLILGKKKNYRTEFPKEDGFHFDPGRDIWDIAKLLNEIAGLDMTRLNRVDSYLREQFHDLEELLPPMDLPVLSALDDLGFLGREAELAEITRRFEAGERFVILSGLGGMGKTELAARFAATRWGGESYLVRFDGNWKQTVLRNIAPMIRGVDVKTADTEKIYRDAMAELKDRSAEELLILDNVDQEDQAPVNLERLKLELSCLNMRILVTTRSDAGQAVDVAQLHRQELYQLFEQHDSAVTPEQRDQLIDAVNGHTLTVDLMARALRRGKRRAATADKLLKNLSDPTIRQVESTYQNPDSPGQAQIIEHLKVVFKVSKLPDAETGLLRCASLLPGDGMDDELFLAPFGGENQDELDNLIDHGWLNWKDGLLSIHPVIRKVCMEVLKPSDEGCGAFLNGLIDQYEDTDFHLEQFRQMAQLLTCASEQLEDHCGRWALKAGERWRNVGEWNRAQICSLRAMERCEQNLPPDDTDLAQAYNNVGVTYGDLGDHKMALKYKLKALAIRERVLYPEHLDLAQSYNNVGGTYGDLGDHKKALEFHQKALAIREKALHPEHPDLANSYNNVGGTYGDLGDHKKALEFLKKALAILEKALHPEHPNLAASYNNVGYTYGDLGDHKKALEFLKKALAIFENALHPEHPHLAMSYDNVGGTYGKLGDHQKSLDFLQKALAIREKALSPEHPHLANSYNNVGITYGDLGDHKKALEFKQKALAIFENALPSEHPDLAMSYNNVGSTYGKLGEHNKALEFQLKALTILEKVLPSEHPNLALSYNNVGGTYGKLGDHKRALEFKQKALAIYEKTLPPEHPDLAQAHNNVAWAYYATEKLPEAAKHMRLAADIICRSSLPETHPDRINYPKWAAELEEELAKLRTMEEAIRITQSQFKGSPFNRYIK